MLFGRYYWKLYRRQEWKIDQKSEFKYKYFIKH